MCDNMMDRERITSGKISQRKTNSIMISLICEISFKKIAHS